MGMGFNGDDIVIKIGMDIDELKSNLSKLEGIVTKSFEGMQSEAKENSKQMQDSFDTAFEKMEREVKGSVDVMNSSINSINKNLSGRFTGALKGVARTIAATFTVYKVTAFGKSVVEAAADLEAMEAAFEQVFDTKKFGDYTKEAERELGKLCDKWDMEMNTLKGDYTSFAAQFKGLGMDMKDSMEYSTVSMELAADAAAMFNIPMQDAIDHVRSFVKGNYVGGESIQLFGSQAMLASYAVEQGIIKEEKAFKELTEAQKQMIRLDFAQHQYELAGTTGQAARESDMYANQLTKLKQKWTDFKAVLGTKALEGVTGVFKDLSSAMESIDAEGLGDAFAKILDILGQGLGDGIKKIADAIGSVNWELFGIFLEDAVDAVSRFAEGVWQGLKDSLVPVAEGVKKVWDSMTGVDEINLEQMDAVNQGMVRMQPALEFFADHGEEIGAGIGSVIKALAQWKAITLTVKISNELYDIFKDGLGVWLATKMGFTGAAAAAAAPWALALAAVIAVQVIWKYQDEDFEKKHKDRIEGKVNPGRSSDGKSKEIMDGEHYDWSKLGKGKGNAVMNGENFDWSGWWKKMMGKGKENATNEGKNYDWKKFRKNFGKNWDELVTNFGKSKGDPIMNGENAKIDWKSIFKGAGTRGESQKGAVMGGKNFDWSDFSLDKLLNGGSKRGDSQEGAVMGGAHFDWKSFFGTEADRKAAIGDLNIMDGMNFDWTPFKTKWDEFWGGIKTSAGTLKSDLKTNWDGIKSECSTFWDGITNSAFGQKVSEMYNGCKESISTWGNDIKTNWSDVKKACSDFWEGITESKFVTGVKTLLSNCKESWVTWKGDIKENWGDIKKACSDFWKGITESKFVTWVKDMLGNAKSKVIGWKDSIVEAWNSLKKKWSGFWSDISNSKFAASLKTFFNKCIHVLNIGITAFLNGLNYIIKGINWIYRKITGNNLFGEIQVSKWIVPKLARGTDNWQGGTALVGEAGRELVSDPKLGTFMADQPMLIPLSKGATVLRNSKTEALLKKMGIPAFAKGKNENIFESIMDSVSSIWEFMTDPKDLWDKVAAKFNLDFSGNKLISGLKEGILDTFDWEFMKKKITKWFKDAIPDVSGIFSVDAWKPYIYKAAAFFGEKLTGNEVERILQQIRNESKGNQTVRQSSQVKDINAETGNWARGLLQYVPSTFASYKVKGFDNINNGYHQLLAFFNNSTWRKALPKLGETRGWSPRGGRRFANGGIVDSATYGVFGEKGTEALVPLSNARALKPFGQSVLNAIKEETDSVNENTVYEFTIPVIIDGREVAKATATFTKEELDRIEKRDNRRNGKW